MSKTFEQFIWDIAEKATNPSQFPATFTVGQDLKKGDKAEITQGGYIVPVFDRKRKEKIIVECLRYCLHRKRSHPEAGLGVCVRDIERVLEKME